MASFFGVPGYLLRISREVGFAAEGPTIADLQSQRLLDMWGHGFDSLGGGGGGGRLIVWGL